MMQGFSHLCISSRDTLAESFRLQQVSQLTVALVNVRRPLQDRCYGALAVRPFSAPEGGVSIRFASE